MQPPAARSRPLLGQPANIGQGTFRNDNALVQSNEGVLTFSLIVTPEHFSDSPHPAPTNDARTTVSSVNSCRNNFDTIRATRRSSVSLRCRFCDTTCPSKSSLLAHYRKHSQDAQRETNALFETLISSLDALGYGIDAPPSATPYGENRAANVTSEQTRARQWGRRFAARDQAVQQTHMTSFTDPVTAPPRNPSLSLEQLNNYAQREDQTGEWRTVHNHGRIASSQSSAGQSSQNLRTSAVESCSIALNSEWANQRSVQHAFALDPALDRNARCTSLRNSVGTGGRRSQSQSSTLSKSMPQVKPRSCDSEPCIVRLEAAQAILSPQKHVVLSAKGTPVAFSESKAIRSSAEAVPSIAGISQGGNNVANNQPPVCEAPTSLPCVKRQSVSLLRKNSSLRISGIEPSLLGKSLKDSLKHRKDADRYCAFNSEQRPRYDQVNSALPWGTESRWPEPPSTDVLPGTGQESSYGVVGVTNISANHGQEDWRAARHEDNIVNGSSVQQWEPEVEPDSTPENTSVSFSLEPVLGLDALEQIVKQGEDADPVLCDLNVDKEKNPGSDCASNSEQRPTHDELTSIASPTWCAEFRWPEPSSTDALPRTGQESSNGFVGVTDTSANHGQEGRRTACHEDTIIDRRLTANASPLSFSLKPIVHINALEQVEKQEEDKVPVTRDLDVAEEESPDGLGNENFNEPSSAPSVPGSASGRDVVTNKSPEPASGGDLITHKGMGHLWKDHITNAELRLSIPNADRAKPVRRKRGIFCDGVANDANAAQLSEHFLDRSLENAKASGAPADITQPDYATGTSQPKRIRAGTSHSPLYDHSHNGAPSPNTAKGAARKKSQVPPVSEENGETSAFASGSRSTETRQCPSCSKVLSCKSSLDRHRQLVHERSRPLKCPHCARSFGLRDSLQNHIRSLHTGERPFGCHLCPKAFPHSPGLQRHLMWHNNVRRHACDLCSGKFVTKEHLERHMRTHTKEKPFACPLCPMRLPTSSALKRHRATHDELPHECEVCGKKYRELRTLRKHSRSQHPTEIICE